MAYSTSIAIIGGGLAGLATAQALAARGIRSMIFEAAPALGEIGAAVGTSPQANKALAAIGLHDQVASVANVSPGIYTRNMQDGQFLEYRDARQAAARFGAPFYTFHRADLLDALVKGIDPSAIHLGHRLSNVTQGEDGVSLAFANGVEVKADIVIGADGVRSVVRQALYGADTPTYTGQMAWRALLKGSDVPRECLEPNGHVQWIGPGRHFIAYYIRGEEVVNIVSQQDTEQWVEESWSARGDPSEMRASFPDAEPRMKVLLDLVKDCSKWGLFTRPLTSDWGHGRIQLIGDAAHAMLPNVGQGACQAFEDAYILARWLDACQDDFAEAFRSFRRIRIPRVHAVQRLAMAAARFKHMQNSVGQKELLAAGKGSTHGNIEWVWDYDPVAEWDKDPIVPATDAHALI
ncbi:FAD-dependent monooxygenase [Caballeronia sordidicola]|uniref:Putative n-hydroxybenzoate hydroxylase n=1 Tax=Caballeronia sordidicola TaxID=196367 RepID=A0A242MY08_CABSO|nr:FAD-dependent monooxygenase [Caballeronia sordidicola]OTP76203.1 putative n-hydroxybenzoate hydroxylase [Caballeronia sordidicola]